MDDRLTSIKSIRNNDDLTLVDIDWLIAEVERLRAVPEAIARKCETSARLHHNPQASQAYSKAAGIARDLGRYCD